MSYSYDLQMSQMHALLGWCALALLLFRGFLFQFRSARFMEAGLKVIVFGVYAILAVTGLSLWVSFLHSPLREPWLMVKLFAVFAYMGCSYWAMGREEFRLLGFMAALTVLGYILAISITRSPFPLA